MSATRPPLVIVAALGRNGGIGRDNRLPWTMPGDLARFRDLTMGTPMIMGRSTFEAIGRVLPGRASIVVSRKPTLPLPDGVFRAANPSTALELAEISATTMRAPSISLIGGAMLFEAMMGAAQRLALTFVDLSPEADAFFPAIDPSVWREASRVAPPRHPRDEAGCVFVDYHRIDEPQAGGPCDPERLGRDPALL